MKKENINEKWSKPLAKVLKNEIKKRKESNPKFSQDEFAELLNISPSTLTLLLKGERNPSLDSVYSIANALDCSIDYLVGLSPIKNRKWSDLDKAIELVSKESGISQESIDKIMNHICLGDPEEKEYFIYCFNQMICSLKFESFLRYFNNYLAFDFEKYNEEFEINELYNSQTGSKEKLLPTAKMFLRDIRDSLSESVIELADFTEHKFKVNKYYLDKYEHIISQYEDEDSTYTERYYEAQTKHTEYKRRIEDYDTYLEITKSNEKEWLDFVEYQEEEYLQSHEEEKKDGKK